METRAAHCYPGSIIKDCWAIIFISWYYTASHRTTPENLPTVPLGNCKNGTELKIWGKNHRLLPFFLFFKKNSLPHFKLKIPWLIQLKQVKASNFAKTYISLGYQVVQFAKRKLNYALCSGQRSLFELLSMVLQNGMNKIEIWMQRANWNYALYCG